MPGLPALQQAVAEHQRRFYGIEFDPRAEITIHAGATEALCATLAALLDPGDEAIVFEPFYDAYLPGIALAQAEARVVPLDAARRSASTPRRSRPRSRRARACSCSTRRATRPATCSRARSSRRSRRSASATTWSWSRDEVYEHIVFEGAHVPIATLPGMRERTVTISSSGKTFSLTGWKIGWSCAAARADGGDARGPPVRHLRGRDAVPARDRRRRSRPTTPTTRELRADYRARRDRLCDGLAAVGFDVRPPEGTYFALADVRPLGFDDDAAFCRQLVETVGVAAIPVSAFTADRPRPPPRALRVLQGRRDARRGAAPARAKPAGG